MPNFGNLGTIVVDYDRLGSPEVDINKFERKWAILGVIVRAFSIAHNFPLILPFLPYFFCNAIRNFPSCQIDLSGGFLHDNGEK